MATKILILSTLFCCLFGLQLLAQERFVTANYYLDDFVLNPSLAGRESGCRKLRLSARQQWLGLPSAPGSQFFSYNQGVSKHWGVGAYFFNDENGATGKSGVHLALAWHASIHDYDELSLGIGLSGWQRSFAITESALGISDPALAAAQKASFWGTANFGLFYATNVGFFSSLSVQSLATVNSELPATEPAIPRSVQVMAGYRFVSRSGRIRYIPSVLLAADDLAQIEFHVNNQLELKLRDPEQSVALGLSVLVRKQATMMTLFQPMIGYRNRALDFRYIYEFSPSKTAFSIVGAHCLSVGIRICGNVRRTSYCRAYGLYE
ncbi:MAG: hypothetical protein RIS47_1389 [Bacteroidota bacterium]|jgi:type IX secretion system PorP/SprF family membrane protein